MKLTLPLGNVTFIALEHISTRSRNYLLDRDKLIDNAG